MSQEILNERAKTHGDFRKQFEVAQELKRIMREAGQELTNVQEEVVDLICTKLSRIAIGNPNHADHWDDIAGYAKLASKEISGEPHV